MATMEIKGIEEYAEQLEKISDSKKFIGKIIYKGAKVMTDAMDKSIDKIPTEKSIKKGMPKRGTKENPINGLTAAQKSDLHKGLGIAKKQIVAGKTNVKIGFDGYGSTPTRKYRDGVPNILLARSVTSGTSFRKKNPAIRNAITRAKKKTLEAMDQEAEKILQEKLKK